jgi:methylenetetrahydrofolate dehydrogenase (NADP+)/methenyltetrahydrofolate cyclohydrolase
MILDGKKISEKRLETLKKKIADSGLTPVLATVLVGEDPASRMYVRMKHAACEKVGIKSEGVVLPADATTEDVLAELETLGRNPEISGILVQLPLPLQVDEEKVIASVPVQKDVDGFTPFNAGLLWSGKPQFAPCTPKGVMTLLEEYGISVRGRRAVVLGRSIDVGRPMASLLLNADATVTICHSKTEHLREETCSADILVAGIGRARFVTADMVKEGAVVIDVGINHDEHGRLCGDVDFEEVAKKASFITPVPGGVGPMTIATLMENTFSAKLLQIS